VITRETAEPTCESIAEQEIAERYLRRELSEAEQDAFERHYFDCPACFERLQTLDVAAGLLRASPPPAGQTVPRPRVSPLILAAGIASLASAAAVWWVLSQGSRGSERSVSPHPPAQATARSGSAERVPAGVPVPARPLEELRRIEPLPPLLFRGPKEGWDPAARAMEKYASHDYVGAAAGFRDALRADPGSLEAALYLGVCELLSGNDAAAIEPLRRVANSGRTSYAETARFYLAKAFLRKGEVESARAELEFLAANGSANARRKSQKLLDALALSGRTP
jgi:tetratricopeptide (TPR) repeat protein